MSDTKTISHEAASVALDAITHYSTEPQNFLSIVKGILDDASKPHHTEHAKALMDAVLQTASVEKRPFVDELQPKDLISYLQNLAITIEALGGEAFPPGEMALKETAQLFAAVLDFAINKPEEAKKLSAAITDDLLGGSKVRIVFNTYDWDKFNHIQIHHEGAISVNEKNHKFGPANQIEITKVRPGEQLGKGGLSGGPN